MITQLILMFYTASVIAALIAFILNYIRLNKYLNTKGLRATFNEDSLFCLILCFIPIINIIYGMLYWNGSQFTDEELETYLQGEEDEYK